MTSPLARVPPSLLHVALFATASAVWVPAASAAPPPTVGRPTAQSEPAAVPATAAWDAFSGEWLASPHAARTVEQGVRAATASMNFLTRPIARRRLLHRFPAPSGLRLHRDGDVFVIEFLGPGATAHALPISGAEVVQHGARLCVRLESAGIHHTGTTAEGCRENRFRLNETDGSLAMETTITSPQLPLPVRYTLLFKRRPGPASPPGD